MKLFTKLLATIVVLALFSITTVFAASENSLTSTPGIVPEKTIFIESNVTNVSEPSKNPTDDIEYIISAPYLKIKLKDTLTSRSTISIQLVNAKWFFRNSIQTEKFENGNLILNGRYSTYDETQGDYKSSSPKNNGGTYYRYGTKTFGVKTDNLPYTLTVNESNDSIAVLYFEEGGESGDTIMIPLVSRITANDTIRLSIDTGVSSISNEAMEYSTSKLDTNKDNFTNTSIFGTVKTTSEIEYAIKDGKDTVIEMGFSTNAAEFLGESFQKLIDNNRNLLITDGITTLSITKEFMELNNLNKAKQIKISLVQQKSDTISDNLSRTLASIDFINSKLLSRLYDYEIKLDGKNLESFVLPLSVSYKLDSFSLTNEQKNNLTGILIARNDQYKQLGGKFSKSNEFMLNTYSTGKIGLIVSNNLSSIMMKINDTSYTLNGNKLKMDVPPQIMLDRTIVPVRFIAEALNAEVVWEQATGLVTIKMGNHTLFLRQGETFPGLEQGPILINDRMMVPLRYISEKFGANVIWENATQTIEIYK